MKKESFGRAFGMEASVYTIENERLLVRATDFGATLVSLVVKGEGGGVDVVLGYDDAAQYAAGNCYFGATAGRVANRIAGAKLAIGGQDYPLFVNDNGCNCLHGGRRGFSHRMFEAECGPQSIVFSRVSPDMEEGFPGRLMLSVSYSIDGGSLVIEYNYSSDRLTAVNVTNHSYFNLNGGGSALDHRLMLNAPLFCRVDKAQIPCGGTVSVAGTPFDFTAEKRVGECLGCGEPQFDITRYYDHPYLFGQGDIKARLVGDRSGIEMTLATDMPGVQFYSGNFAGSEVGKGGTVYEPYPAVCLETQFMPNGIAEGNGESLVEPGRQYKSKTIYSFK